MEKHKKDQETRIVSARPARRIRGLVLTLAAILIAVIAAVAVITLPKRSGAQELAEALELGEKYLSELNYEQAIASYRAAIEIDPKCADAYIGLADTYLAMGESEEAVKVLRQAEQAVVAGSDADEEEKRKAEEELRRIREKKEEAEKRTADADLPTVAPEPTASPTEVVKIPEPTLTPVLGVINWQDAALEQAMRERMGIIGRVITEKDVEGITELDLSGKGIWNIEALRAMPQLNALDLRNNRISDIRVLAALTELKTLYLDGNPLRDLSVLSGLSVLEKLSVNSSEGVDLDVLFGLPALKELMVDGVRVVPTPEPTTAPEATPTLEPIPTPTPEPTQAPTPTAVPLPTPAPTPEQTEESRVSFSGKTVELNKAEIGDTVIFGRYEQDNDLSNGAEPVEWFVLDKKDGKVLLLSKYALDAKSYNAEDKDVTWKTCTLRSWLNTEFYGTAFSGVEREAIEFTYIKNESTSEDSTENNGGIEDKIFLLSVEEATSYFSPVLIEPDPARRTILTRYAEARGGWVNDTEEYYGNGWWWLRSSGSYRFFAAYVDFSGSIEFGGGYVSRELVVRPALWLDAEQAGKLEASASPERTPTPTPVPQKTSDKRVSFSGKTVELEKAEIGDTVIFGRYEQDNDASNGAEPVEWLVLDKKDGKMLLLSKYALDCKRYNEERVDITWEACTLRNWLNNEFCRAAFDEGEQEVIVTMNIKNEDNIVEKDNGYTISWNTFGGNDTKDKVFLLSIGEATTYFNPDPDMGDPARITQVTEYAKAQGGKLYEGEAYCWWLRSPGSYSDNAAIAAGSVDYWGHWVDMNYNFVRPALWLTLEH